MNILLIEDDLNKAERISSFLHETYPKTVLTKTRSYQSGLRAVMTKQFDLLLIDMTLPVFEVYAGERGFDTYPFAGEDILEEMVRKKIRGKAIIITQFETFGEGENAITLQQLEARLAKRFPGIFLKVIYYSAAESTWKVELTDLIRTV